jgi:hypothetical protein
MQIVLAMLLIGSTTEAADVVCENDPAAWEGYSGETSLINFEVPNIPDGSVLVLEPDEYIGLPGQPTLTPLGSAVNGLIDMGPGAPYWDDFIPFSGDQFLALRLDGECCSEGVIQVVFAQPVYAFSAWFLDVEMDYVGTGFDLDGVAPVDVHFSAEQGDDSHAFLGFVSDTPVYSVDIHLSTADPYPSDGVAIDDIRYSLDSCPYDLTGTGTVNTYDLLTLLALWGDPYSTMHLLDLLSAWGPCP